MSDDNQEVESYDDWTAAMRTADLRPLHKWRLQEMFEATCRYGSGNCWTGITGTLATMVRRLLEERLRLVIELEKRSINQKDA